MKKIKKCIIGYRRKENYSMKKSMIYRVLIYIAGLLILAMESNHFTKEKLTALAGIEG